MFLFNNWIAPVPESVNLTSVPVTPIRPIGSIVTLICIVELSSFVDVQMTVNTVMTGPAGLNLPSTSQSVMENATTYTYTATISSFGREQSGNYICRASVHSTSSFVTGMNEISRTAYITTGSYTSEIHTLSELISHAHCLFGRCLSFS